MGKKYMWEGNCLTTKSEPKSGQSRSRFKRDSRCAGCYFDDVHDPCFKRNQRMRDSGIPVDCSLDGVIWVLVKPRGSMATKYVKE